MKGSLPEQLKMAFFGIAPNDHHLATRQSAASPRDRRAKQYDRSEQLRTRMRDVAQSAADHLAGNGSAIVTPVPTRFATSEQTSESGLFTDPTGEVVEPIFPVDPTSTAASAADPAPDSDSGTTILPSPLTAPQPVAAFSVDRAQTPARAHRGSHARLGDLPKI